MYAAIGLFVALCALSQVNSVAIGQNFDYLTKIVSKVSSLDVGPNGTWTVPVVGETEKFLARYPGGKRPSLETNSGDLIYSTRQPDDMLLIRDIFVPDTVDESRRDLFWNAVIPGGKITQVRALNFGDEKAFATNIEVNKGSVRLYFTIQPQADPRVIFEVYGFAKDQ
ncbi:hypothetical protein HUJ04_002319 [Dendroctonus ponderosae]